MKKTYFILPLIISALGGCSQVATTDNSALSSARIQGHVKQTNTVTCMGKFTYADRTVIRNVTSPDNEDCGTFHRLEFQRRTTQFDPNFTSL